MEKSSTTVTAWFRWARARCRLNRDLASMLHAECTAEPLAQPLANQHTPTTTKINKWNETKKKKIKKELPKLAACSLCLSLKTARNPSRRKKRNPSTSTLLLFFPATNNPALPSVPSLCLPLLVFPPPPSLPPSRVLTVSSCSLVFPSSGGIAQQLGSTQLLWPQCACLLSLLCNIQAEDLPQSCMPDTENIENLAKWNAAGTQRGSEVPPDSLLLHYAAAI